MLELIAVGPDANQRWRRIIPPAKVIRLGRAPQDGWDVPWDMRISRDHADMILESDGLRVKCLRSARNSIYVRGEPNIDFTVQPGESFRIGVTTFHVESSDVDAPMTSNSNPPEERLDEALDELTKQSSKDRLEALLSHLDADTGDEANAANELGVAEEAAADSDSDDERTPFEIETGDVEDASEVASEMGFPVYYDMPESDVEGEFIDGAAFGNYELLDQIYRGGTGQILKAKHRFMDRVAAIKLLSMASAENPETLARFRRKMRLHSYFDHPNLVSSYDAGELEGMQYLILEYVDGMDLVRMLRKGILKVHAAIHYMIQACEALTFAHDLGVVHRNINPSHILIGPRGQVKLIGWGSAFYDDQEPLTSFEGEGKLIGVLDYVAPEQLADSTRVDPRTDIYSLGCTLFAILTRRVVYPVDWPRRKAIAQRFQPPPSLRELRPDVSETLEAVYLKMMEKSAEGRFQTVAELTAALRNAL